MMYKCLKTGKYYFKVKMITNLTKNIPLSTRILVLDKTAQLCVVESSVANRNNLINACKLCE